MDNTEAAPLQDADLGASKPVPQPQYKTRPFQLPTVIACGHLLDTRHLPRYANCEHCWAAFWETNVEFLPKVHELLLNSGTKAVTAIYGAKFTEALGGYLRKQLLKLHGSAQVQAASGIEVVDVQAERTGQ